MTSCDLRTGLFTVYESCSVAKCLLRPFTPRLHHMQANRSGIINKPFHTSAEVLNWLASRACPHSPSLSLSSVCLYSALVNHLSSSSVISPTHSCAPHSVTCTQTERGYPGPSGTHGILGTHFIGSYSVNNQIAITINTSVFIRKVLNQFLISSDVILSGFP